jgi:hypothetical protein
MNNMNPARYTFLLMALMLLTTCSKEKKFPPIPHVMTRISETEWQKLSGKRIFFGHQSVGYNIIEGIASILKDNPELPIKVKETHEVSDLGLPVIAHFQIGKNRDPKSKIDAFAAFLRNGLADSIDIAFMKLCFVDFNKHTNTDDLFGYYKKAMDSLRHSFPNLTIMHSTVPLLAKSSGIKAWIKLILRMDNNVYINRYNELIRENYTEDILFDIAKIESTYPNGTFYRYAFGMPGLIPEYSQDGAHLNRQGSVILANEMFIKLVKIDNTY